MQESARTPDNQMAAFAPPSLSSLPVTGQHLPGRDWLRRNRLLRALPLPRRWPKLLRDTAQGNENQETGSNPIHSSTGTYTHTFLTHSTLLQQESYNVEIELPARVGFSRGEVTFFILSRIEGPHYSVTTDEEGVKKLYQ